MFWRLHTILKGLVHLSLWSISLSIQFSSHCIIFFCSSIRHCATQSLHFVCYVCNSTVVNFFVRPFVSPVFPLCVCCARNPLNWRKQSLNSRSYSNIDFFSTPSSETRTWRYSRNTLGWQTWSFDVVHVPSFLIFLTKKRHTHHHNLLPHSYPFTIYNIFFSLFATWNHK